MTRIWIAALAVSASGVSAAAAQSTGLPSFNSPYRHFARSEAGFAVDFPGFDDVAVEGLYRFGHGQVDLGVRGGVWFVRQGIFEGEVFVLGAEARHRVIEHSDDFPADGAVIVGAGVQLGDIEHFVPSVGLSLGRRLEVEDSDVTIVPFVQPHLWWLIGDADEIEFGVGLGADFRLTPRFDLRASIGVGDVDGLSVSAVWIR